MDTRDVSKELADAVEALAKKEGLTIVGLFSSQEPGGRSLGGLFRLSDGREFVATLGREIGISQFFAMERETLGRVALAQLLIQQAAMFQRDHASRVPPSRPATRTSTRASTPKRPAGRRRAPRGR